MLSIAYDRLLRVPSEILPLETRSKVPDYPFTATWHSAIIWEWTTPYAHPIRAHLHFRRRKGEPLPSTLDMHCGCQGANMPPVDATKDKFLHWPDYPCASCRLFDLWTLARAEHRPRIFTVTANELSSYLTDVAAVLNLNSGERVQSHSFRRGATRDLADRGMPASSILRLAGRRAATTLKFMTGDDLEPLNYALKLSEDSLSD